MEGAMAAYLDSKTEAYYFRCIRLLAEYCNFGIVHIRNDFKRKKIHSVKREEH